MSKLPANDTAQSQVDHPSNNINWDSNFANYKIRGTGEESPKNQWTAAATLTGVGVFDMDGDDSSFRKASFSSSRDDPAASVDSNDTKNQCCGSGFE